MTIPDTMRAAVLRDPARGLEIETLRTPRPRAGEVLVKVTACGMCHSDLHVIAGSIAFPKPCVLGHEVSGTIVALGEGTASTGLQVGQAVAGAFLMPCGHCPDCSRGRDELCGPFFTMNRLQGVLYDGETRLFSTAGEPIQMYSMGGLAEYAVIPATSVAVLPESMDMVASAILGCAAMTAYGAVRHSRLEYGESVGVVAVGGVGSNIVQICQAMGASQVVAIDVSNEKLEQVRQFGATGCVNTREQDARTAVLELTNGHGLDVVFEALGLNDTWQVALDVLADGGRMVPVGLGAGRQSAEVEINRLVRRSQSVLGSYGARTRVDLPAVIDMAARGWIKYRDVVTSRLSLDQAGEGYQALREGRIMGRAVVDMTL